MAGRMSTNQPLNASHADGALETIVQARDLRRRYVLLALSGSGYVLSIPVLTLIVLLIAAALAGLLAAQAPARRAARLDVLGALASE
jgi:ABC-type antimicrobial peptide transport system permease subunit